MRKLKDTLLIALSHFINVGVNSSLSNQKIKQIRLSNSVNFAVILVNLPYLFWAYFQEYYLSLAVIFLFINIYFGLVALNFLGLNRSVRHITILVGNLHILSCSFLLGERAGVQNMFFAAVCAPMFFFPGNRRQLLLGLISTLLAYSALILTYAQWGSFYAPTLIHRFSTADISFGIALVAVYLFVYYFAVENKKSEDLLTHMLKELRETQASLIQKEKLVSLGTLAAGIAHELNNSLNYASGSIRSMERYLAKIPDSEEKSKMSGLFSLIKKGVGLSVEIITNLKNYSIQDRGGTSEVRFIEVVQTIIAILKTRMQAQGRTITTILDIPADMIINANHAGMNQLMMNLVSNAIDAITGKGTITISAKMHQEFWEMSVTDTGEGISNSNLNRIFDPFFTTKEVGKGTGLGLFVVRTEVLRHRGDFEVTSELGQGTTFSFKFPLSSERE